MKIEVFEVNSKEDKVYLELLEQYKNNPETKELLDEFVIPTELVLMGDFSLLAMMGYGIQMDSMKIYLVKDIDAGTFLLVLGVVIKDNGINDKGKIYLYPLVKEISKEQQLAARSALIENGIFNKPDLSNQPE